MLPLRASPSLLLYVEDEVIIQFLVEGALREAGYETLTVCNGADAIAALEDAQLSFAGLVTDINLGEGPEGWDIADMARRIIPELPVVYVSGASGHQWIARGVSGSLIVGKPFAPAAVVAAISSLIEVEDGLS